MSKINDTLRAGDVDRWTIVRTAKRQSLAEHSFNVAMIAKAIAVRLGILPLGLVTVQVEALEHDMEEIFGGDVPTPAKYKNNEQYLAKFLSMGMVDRVIKLADIMETTWFIRENGVGAHAGQVHKASLSRLSLLLKHCEPDVYEAAIGVWEEMSSTEFTE